MKLEEELLVIEKSANLNITGFGIEASAQAFEILYSSIYSDKISAVIRELCTNAWDANVSVNKGNEPILVHLPNTFESWFSVKDNGTGLSEESIRSLYTTLFKSDKRNSNDLAGCLGLGSKSPFAYTTCFNVISIFEGKKSVYTFFINSDRVPSVTRLGEPVSTDEPNGLEVKISVEKKDFNDFNYKASVILGWFEPKPLVTGVHNFNFKKYNYTTQSKDYKIIHASDRDYYGNSSRLIMGNVAYPVLSNDLDKHNFSYLEKEIIKSGVHFFVPIGSFKFTPGRESITYDQKTIDFLHKIIGNVVEDVKLKVNKEISEAKTKWQARTIIFNFSDHIYKEIVKQDSLIWNNEPLSSSLSVNKHSLIKLGIPEEELSSIKIECLENNKTKQNTTLIEADNTPFFVSDIKIGNYSKIYNYLNVNKKKYAYLISNNKSLISILKEEGVELQYTSTLSDAPREKNDREKSKGYSRVNRFLDNNSPKTIINSYWEPIDDDDVDDLEDGIYVNINRGNVYLSNSTSDKIAPERLINILRDLSKYTGKTLPVYGIREKDLDVAIDHDWIDLFDVLLDIYNTNQENYANIIAIQNSFVYSNITELCPLVPENNVLFDNLRKLLKIRNDAQLNTKIQLFSKLACLVNPDWINTKAISEESISGIIEEIRKKYPMLKLYEEIGYNYARYNGIVLDYIKTIDKENQDNVI